MTNRDRKILIEVIAQHSGIGKSLTADLIYLNSKNAHVTTSLVRIEAKRRAKTQWKDEILVHTEQFKHTGETQGGEVGILAPLFDKIEALEAKAGVIICDWGAGLRGHRYNAFASSAIDAILAASGIEMFSFVITNREIDKINEAAELVLSNRALLPIARTEPHRVCWRPST